MTLTRQSMVFAALIVGALILEVAILVWFFGGPDASDDDPVTRGRVESDFDEMVACGQTSISGAPSNARFDDARLFAIGVPPEWESTVDGSVVTLEKRNGRATLSMGRARSGDLSAALRDLRSSLSMAYQDLRVISAKPLVLDGCPARSVAGRARNDRGASLNFEGVVVAGPTDNFVIAGFLERGSEPRLNAKVQRVIRSVRLYLSDQPARS